MRKIAGLFDSVNNFLAFLVGLILIYIMVSVCMEIVLRYFGHPTIWVIEVAEYALLFIPFLGTAWLLREEGHVKMDLVLSQLSVRAQIFINIITSILAVIACLIMTWFSLQATWEHFQKGWVSSTLLEVPLYLILVVIPVGYFLLSIQFVRRTHRFSREVLGHVEGKR